MGFRLIQDEVLSRGLRRIARDEIDEAILHLSTKETGKRDHSIHEARKSIKKLRGLLRMLSPVLGESAKVEVDTLGELGRALSEFRDAAAIIETVDLLGCHCGDASVLAQLTELRTTLSRKAEQTCRRSDLRDALQHGIVGLRRLRRATALWKPADSFDTIGPGLKKSYRRGRQALRKVQDQPTSERFHDLRKRVKDCWYQVRVLEGLWSQPAVSPERALRDLQEDLGDDHNLEVLSGFIPAGAAELRELAGNRQRDLRAKSLESAAALYSRKPSEFLAEMETLWTHWSSAVALPPKSVVSAVSKTAAVRAIA